MYTSFSVLFGARRFRFFVTMSPCVDQFRSAEPAEAGKLSSLMASFCSAGHSSPHDFHQVSGLPVSAALDQMSSYGTFLLLARNAPYSMTSWSSILGSCTKHFIQQRSTDGFAEHSAAYRGSSANVTKWTGEYRKRNL